MLDILTVTGPIYLIIGIGYLATRLGLVAPQDMRIFGRYVLYIAIPALLIRALTANPVGEVVNPAYLAAYAAGSLVLLVAGYLVVRRLLGASGTAATFSAMGMVCANSGFVGYPIMLLVFPAIAGNILALNFIVENVIVVPLLLALAERAIGEKGNPLATAASMLRGLSTNPVIIAIAVGLLLSALRIELPQAAARTVDLIASSSAAISLFVIGGTLVGLPMRGMNHRLAPIVVGKLLLHPLAVGLFVFVLPLLGLPAIPSPYREAAILSAAMPVFSIYPILAQKYGEDGMAAVALMATTLISFVTVSALLWMLAGGTM